MYKLPRDSTSQVNRPRTNGFVTVISSQREGLGKMALGIVKYFYDCSSQPIGFIWFAVSCRGPGISLLSLPGRVYAKCLERKCREIVESKLQDSWCGFRPGRSTTDQTFTLKQIFEKCWEYSKDLVACFVDLEKAFDRVPRDKLWKVLR